MKLIADSGSTKTDWIFQDNSGVRYKVQTAGINPFFRTTEQITEELKSSLLKVCTQVDEVFFYGAGIVNEEKAFVIKEAISNVYGKINCEALSDVVGAARATCENKPGIVCILGTGSNACFFDGSAVVNNIPPMGFILGDEGSGAVMGRNLVGDYFKLVMPEHIRKKFEERFSLQKDDVLNCVYRQPGANRYLAQFTVFLSEEIDEEYCHEFVYENLQSFIRRNVLKLPQKEIFPVNFVGSVAFNFKKILIESLLQEKLIVGKIIKDPIENLAKFHE